MARKLPAKDGKDGVENSFALAKDLMVPEAKDRVAVTVQESGSDDIRFALGVLLAVEFQDEVLRPTEEVHNIGPKRRLAYELEPGKLIAAETTP